jgi:tetratricopeptide (TPR) repeat protein
MQIPLHTSFRRVLVAGAAVVLTLAYATLVGRELLAWWFGQRVELASLQRAVWLDPGNADYRDHLGRYYALVARDPGASLAPYRAAVTLNPHSARYWFDLASSYQILGDIANQAAALEQAIQADPTTPDVAWEAANLYLVLGENEKALREFRVVLENDPYLPSAAVRLCWRIEPDVDALLRDVVPARPEALVPLLDLLMAKKETSATSKVWAVLMQTRQPFELPTALEYFRYLVLQKAPDSAVQVWQQTTSRFGLASYLPSASNLMVNGDFNLDILNGGLDWQYKKQSSVTLTLDPSESHGGRRSLLINFEGIGVRDAEVFQFIPVQPATTYEFSGYYKTGEFEGAGAPRFTVQDVYNPTIFFESEDLKDSSFWKSASGDFTTGPDTRLLWLHIRRLPEGSPIRGKLWIDDFRLVKKSTQSLLKPRNP